MKRAKLEELKTLREDSAKYYSNIPALNWGELIDGKYVMSDRYDFDWKFCQGETKKLTSLPTDLHTYIKDFQKKNFDAGRSVSALIGTDSQNHLSYTRFVTAICLVVERNGVHVLISRMEKKKIYDLKDRLLRETDISTEFARNNKEFFKSIDMPLTIHADYNNQKTHKSNNIVMEASNYAKTIGFNLLIKPVAFGASYAADHFC